MQIWKLSIKHLTRSGAFRSKKGCEMTVFCLGDNTGLLLCFLLQILDKIWENPCNRICADCGMKGRTFKVNFHFTVQILGLPTCVEAW